MIMFKRSATLSIALLMAAAGVGQAAGPAQAAGHPVKGNPGAATTRTALSGGPYFFYANRWQLAATAGAYTTMDAETPALAVGDFHTLGEMAVQKQVGGTQQIVEIGWNKDPGLYGDSNAHLFVSAWKNGVWTGCYNGCGFMQIPQTDPPTVPQAGQTLGTGSANAKRYGLQYSATLPSGPTPGGWWAYFDNKGVGVWPNTMWGASAFSTSDKVQFFGEVAANVTAPCTDMGTGTQGSTTALPAAFSSSISYLSGPAVSLTTQTTNAAYYSVGVASARTFYDGGPGAC